MRSLRPLALLILALGGCEAVVDPPPPLTPSLAKAAGPITYALIGPSGSFGFGVNDAGQVAGGIGTDYDIHRAFVWTPTTPRGSAGTLTELGSLGGGGVYTASLNSAGWVVGSSSDAAGTNHAFLWTAARGLTRFGLTTEPDNARDVNDAGQVVGTVGPSVVRWNVTVAADGSVQSGELEQLGTLPNAGSTVPFAINGVGQAVGWAVLSSNRAVLWTRDAAGWIVEDLGVPAGHIAAVARDVNDAGLVVGFSRPSQGCSSAVVWTTAAGRKTSMHVLPTLGGCDAEAYGVNNQGDVVGRSWNQKGVGRATIWMVAADGSVLSVRDLGAPNPTTPGIAYQVSSRINGVAQATGFLRAGNNTPQATLWTIR